MDYRHHNIVAVAATTGGGALIRIVSQALDDYCVAHTTRAGALLDELAAYTHAHCKAPQMLTGPVEGALLRMLVQTSAASRVLEIGTFTGYSALSMAAGLQADGLLITCEIDPEHARIAQSFFDRSPHGTRIQLLLGPALESLRGLPADTVFDFAFVDADKENYINYYEAILARLKPGGLIAADNTLWSGRVLDPKEKTDRAIVAFNDHVARDTRVECVLLSVRDGVMLIRKRG
jgi:caffeoyl-CoA O-methyltransferase